MLIRKGFFQFCKGILRDTRGIVGEDINNTDSGNADTQAANVSGEVEGAGTQEQAQTPEIPEGQEPNIGTEGNEYDSLPAENRIQQLANKAKEIESQLEQERSARLAIEARLRTAEEERPDFDGPEVVRLVEANIVKALKAIKQLESEIDLEDEPSFEQAKKLLDLQGYVRSAQEALAKNEEKQKAWFAKKEEKTQQSSTVQAKNARQGEIAKLYAEHHKIPDAVMHQKAAVFQQEMANNALFREQYVDKLLRLNDDFGAFEYAFNHVSAVMEKQAQATQQAMQKKEEGKNNLPPGKSATGVSTGPDLAKLHAKAQETGSEEDYLAYVQAKRAARQK